MRIAVGSKNPVKIAAVANVVKKIWPDAEVIGIEVDHGMGIQPNSTEEGISGATKRAELALKEGNADIGFGLEGNTRNIEYGTLLDGWVVAIGKQGNRGIANSGSILLPEKVAAEVRKGKELGPVMDELIGEHNTKQKEGTVGILTKGMLTRTQAFENGVTCALAPFLSPQYYQ